MIDNTKYSEFKTQVQVDSHTGEYFIEIPEKLLSELEWKEGDEIEWDVTENCFDWGEVDSFILRNLTQEESL